jgi:hypothetical protein
MKFNKKYMSLTSKKKHKIRNKKNTKKKFISLISKKKNNTKKKYRNKKTKVKNRKKNIKSRKKKKLRGGAKLEPLLHDQGENINPFSTIDFLKTLIPEIKSGIINELGVSIPIKDYYLWLTKPNGTFNSVTYQKINKKFFRIIKDEGFFEGRLQAVPISKVEPIVEPIVEEKVEPKIREKKDLFVDIAISFITEILDPLHHSILKKTSSRKLDFSHVKFEHFKKKLKQRLKKKKLRILVIPSFKENSFLEIYDDIIKEEAEAEAEEAEKVKSNSSSSLKSLTEQQLMNICSNRLDRQSYEDKIVALVNPRINGIIINLKKILNVEEMGKYNSADGYLTITVSLSNVIMPTTISIEGLIVGLLKEVLLYTLYPNKVDNIALINTFDELHRIFKAICPTFLELVDKITNKLTYTTEKTGEKFSNDYKYYSPMIIIFFLLFQINTDTINNLMGGSFSTYVVLPSIDSQTIKILLESDESDESDVEQRSELKQDFKIHDESKKLTRILWSGDLSKVLVNILDDAEKLGFSSWTQDCPDWVVLERSKLAYDAWSCLQKTVTDFDKEQFDFLATCGNFKNMWAALSSAFVLQGCYLSKDKKASDYGLAFVDYHGSFDSEKNLSFESYTNTVMYNIELPTNMVFCQTNKINSTVFLLFMISDFYLKDKLAEVEPAAAVEPAATEETEGILTLVPIIIPVETTCMKEYSFCLKFEEGAIKFYMRIDDKIYYDLEEEELKLKLEDTETETDDEDDIEKVLKKLYKLCGQYIPTLRLLKLSETAETATDDQPKSFKEYIEEKKKGITKLSPSSKVGQLIEKTNNTCLEEKELAKLLHKLSVKNKKYEQDLIKGLEKLGNNVTGNNVTGNDNYKVLSLEKYLTEKEVAVAERAEAADQAEDQAAAELEAADQAAVADQEEEADQEEAADQAEDQAAPSPVPNELVLEIENLSWYIGIYGVDMFKGKPVVIKWEKDLKEWIQKIKKDTESKVGEVNVAEQILKNFNQNQSKIELNQQQKRQELKYKAGKKLLNKQDKIVEGLIREVENIEEQTKNTHNREKKRLAEQTLLKMSLRRPKPPSKSKPLGSTFRRDKYSTEA